MRARAPGRRIRIAPASARSRSLAASGFCRPSSDRSTMMRHVVSRRRHIAGNDWILLREKQRIDKSPSASAGSPGETSSGRHTARPLCFGEIAERERREMKFHVPDELKDLHDLVLDAFEHAIDEPRQHLLFGEPVPAQQRRQLVEETADRRRIEPVALVLPHGEHFETAHAPVEADAHAEVERRQVLVIVEQIAQALVSHGSRARRRRTLAASRAARCRRRTSPP